MAYILQASLQRSRICPPRMRGKSGHREGEKMPDGGANIDGNQGLERRLRRFELVRLRGETGNHAQRPWMTTCEMKQILAR